jgi:hypothetical protein
MIKLYLSSVETEYKNLDRMFSRGYPVWGIEAGFRYIRDNNFFQELIRKWNVDYKIKTLITPQMDSTYRNLGKDDISDIFKDQSEVDSYFEEYLKWLLEYPQMYENALEFRYNGISSVDLAKYRQRYIDAGIARHIVILFDDSEGIPVVKDLFEKGFKWFSYIGTEDNNVPNIIKEVSSIGGFNHLRSFTNYEIYDIRENIDSVSSSVWTLGSRNKAIYFLKFGKLKEYNVEKDSDSLTASLQDRFWNVFSDDIRSKVAGGKSLHYINCWNAYQLQSYVDHLNTKIPAYKDYLKNGGEIPEFAEGVDASGRDKIKEIAKFRNPTNAVFSRGIMNFGLQCNTCIIRDKCTAYMKDSACAYTNVWKETGSLNTRNVEAVISSLEAVIEEQNQRLIRSQFIESTQGGYPKKDITELQNSLIRNLDILYKLKFGTTNQNKYNILNIGSNKMVVGSVEDILQNVRSSFDSKSFEKIKKNVENNVSEEVEDGGTTEQ